jgi:hypothetical protein
MYLVLMILFYCTKLEKQLHINFLFLQEEEKSHYVWIKSISRLLKSQITENHRQIYRVILDDCSRSRREN